MFLEHVKNIYTKRYVQLWNKFTSKQLLSSHCREEHNNIKKPCTAKYFNMLRTVK